MRVWLTPGPRMFLRLVWIRNAVLLEYGLQGTDVFVLLLNLNPVPVTRFVGLLKFLPHKFVILPLYAFVVFTESTVINHLIFLLKVFFLEVADGIVVAHAVKNRGGARGVKEPVPEVLKVAEAPSKTL